MADLIVRLYALDAADIAASVGTLRDRGIVIRRALAPERRPVTTWVADRFGDGWAGETEAAFSRTPTSCFLALRERALLGFACFDVTALGFFGPTGVEPEARGEGVGAALLRAALMSMREAGYAYAIIGGVGPVDFYGRTVGAVPIPDSMPGIYAGLLRSSPPSQPSPETPREPQP